MTYISRRDVGYLLNNADVLNKIVLHRITHYGAHGSTANTDQTPFHTQAANNCGQNKKLMEQIQNLQSVVDLLVELRR